MKAFSRHLVFCYALLAAPQALATCGAAFCTINTNWDAHGAWAEPGWRFDLRYEHILQQQPQTGTDRLSLGQISKHHDEVFTENKNWLATLDYTFNADWGVALYLPFVDRNHLHIHNHRGVPIPEAWEFSSVGDARVVGRYRIASFEDKEPKLSSTGLYFGLKLPTGNIDVRNGSGALAERSLQPGTGTTDAIFGGYFAQLLPVQDLSWFAEALVQVPTTARDGYKPGSRFSVDTGVRWNATEHFSLMLQLNGLFRDRDSGVNAEPADSGGKAWFLSPGFSYSLTKDAVVYAYYQQPVYQYVNGVQLTARGASAIGVSVRF